MNRPVVLTKPCDESVCRWCHCGPACVPWCPSALRGDTVAYPFDPNAPGMAALMETGRIRAGAIRVHGEAGSSA